MMTIVYSVEVGDPIENSVKRNPNTYFNTISDALTDALYLVERLEKIHGKEFVFSEKEPIIKGSKENSLHIWRGYVDGITEPLYIQLNIEEHDEHKQLAIPNRPSSKLSENQMIFVSELEIILNQADNDDRLFYH
jgi:hypothetical protein